MRRGHYSWEERRGWTAGAEEKENTGRDAQRRGRHGERLGSSFDEVSDELAVLWEAQRRRKHGI